MDIAERIEKAVGDILPTYYADLPDFGDNAPDRYIIYELVERGGEYGEGISHAADYMVTLNIITPTLDIGQYELIKAAMQAAGFSYQGGGSVQSDKSFPVYHHWYQDYGG